MDNRAPSKTATEEPVAVDNWPMSSEAIHQQLKKAQAQLEQYQSSLHLASHEIEQLKRGIVAVTAFTSQAGRITKPLELLKLALIRALEVVEAPSGAIVLIEPETTALTLSFHKGLPPKLLKILAGHHFGDGAMALMPHLAAGEGTLFERDTGDDVEQQLLQCGALHSLVSLPLRVGAKLLGAFVVGRQDETHFQPGELRLLMTIAQETAAALENLHLRDGLWSTAETLLGHQQLNVELLAANPVELDLNLALNLPQPPPADALSSPPLPNNEDDLEQLLMAMMAAEDEIQQQNSDLQAINAIAEMMNRTLNLKNILQHAVDQTQTLLKTEAAWVYMVNDRRQLKMRAHQGLSTAYVRGMHALAWGDGLEGRVAATNKPHFIEAVRDDPHNHKIWIDKEGLQALAAVPIARPEYRLKDEPDLSPVVGVLVTGFRTHPRYAWTPREIRLLTSIANQLALAIENAWLHAQVQENETSLRAGNQILQEINNMLAENNETLSHFIHQELEPAMGLTTGLLERLTNDEQIPLTEQQEQDVMALQQIFDRLKAMAQEIADTEGGETAP
jgi:GAF domain-containing protein